MSCRFARMALLIAVMSSSLALASVGPASAADFYVAPGASGVCTQADPCGLQTGLDSAYVGDTVFMLSDRGPWGTEVTPMTAAINVEPDVTLSGVPGQAMPTLYIDDDEASAAVTLGSQSVLRGVRIEAQGNLSAVRFNGSRLDRVYARSSTADYAGLSACRGGAGTIVNSVCWGRWGLLAEVGSGKSLEIRNSTLVGVIHGAKFDNLGGGGSFSLHNSIFSGNPDISAEYPQTGSYSITAESSNYSSTAIGLGVTCAAPGSGTNQTAEPIFVDAATGDFREAPSSPTIDAGSDDGANGTQDLAGLARTRAVATDIGAYEYVAAPSVTTQTAGDVGQTSARVTGSVTTGEESASYHFEYGTTTTYGSRTASTSLIAGLTPVAVEASLEGLLPGTLYHYRLVANGPGGTTVGADATFSTLPAIQPPAVQPAKFATLASRKLAIKRNRAIVGVRCAKTPGGVCAGRIELRTKVKKGVVLGRLSFRVKAGAKATLKIRLTRKGRNALKSRKTLKAFAIQTVAAADGKPQKKTQRVRIKR